ncbi:uncharacterized protein Pyn_24418 [Prunus yedoensis var. nudiflora]|uniref:F-box domain-containing protein n=1 Tax=Prunus yedoensis var. nudiflora TaxID=2094558 RepID=A0A314U7C9_PRUYE|nr:uncharacterized protein Pyn_24418 [Prunus yedoensis var. nudiflora]
MNSKYFTTIGGKRRKHIHLEMPQAFIPELAWFKVMLYVATQSSEDLFRMASVCPLFRTLANTPKCGTPFQWLSTQTILAGTMQSCGPAFLATMQSLREP